MVLVLLRGHSGWSLKTIMLPFLFDHPLRTSLFIGRYQSPKRPVPLSATDRIPPLSDLIWNQIRYWIIFSESISRSALSFAPRWGRTRLTKLCRGRGYRGPPGQRSSRTEGFVPFQNIVFLCS